MTGKLNDGQKNSVDYLNGYRAGHEAGYAKGFTDTKLAVLCGGVAVGATGMFVLYLLARLFLWLHQ